MNALLRPTPPLLMLDVDGVLVIKPDRDRHNHLTNHHIVDSSGVAHTIWLDERHPALLEQLLCEFEPVWATGWEHEAARLLGPLLGLPSLPVVSFTQRPRVGTPIDKLPDVRRYAGGRALAWIDDELSDREIAWATRRAEPTLLIRPNPSLGLTEAHVEELLSFSGALMNG